MVYSEPFPHPGQYDPIGRQTIQVLKTALAIQPQFFKF